MAAIEPVVRHTISRCLIELEEDAHSSAEAAVAFDEVLAEQVDLGASPSIVRIWRNRRAVVVPRSRLAGRQAGRVVDARGRSWPVCGRSSGGAAVAHGPGTLNVSLILPLRRRFALPIDACYRLWIGLLDAALRETCGVEVRPAEVPGAFCGGAYDAVADGARGGSRKLAGVAQARRGRSVVVHGTILTGVDRREYVSIVEAAEELIGLTGGPYDPNRVVSLHELIERSVPTLELVYAVARAAIQPEEGRR